MALLEKLHELFLLDGQVRGLESRLDSASGRVRAQQTKVDRLDQQKAELDAQLKHAKVKLASSESQSQGLQEKIDNFRERMNQVKSNKEYSALLIEVNTLKVDSGKIEEQILEEMTDVERLEKELSELGDSATDQRRMVDLAQQDVDRCRDEVGQELDGLKVKRADAAALVPNDARGVFDRLVNAYEGEALASVVEANRRAMEYSCGGCYMSIPVERVNALMTRPEELVECPNCGRILYLDHELKAAFAK